LNIESQIEAVLKKYYDAFLSKSWNVFESLLDDKFTYFTDKCTIQNREEFLKFMMSDKWKGSGYSLSDLKFIISGNDDLAIAKYKVEFKGFVKDTVFDVFAIETTIFSLKNGTWKIIHSHTSNKV